MGTRTNEKTLTITPDLRLALRGAVLDLTPMRCDIGGQSIGCTLPLSVVGDVAAHTAAMRGLDDLPAPLRAEAEQLVAGSIRRELARFKLCPPPPVRPTLGIGDIRRASLWTTLALVQWAVVCRHRIAPPEALRLALMVVVDAVTRPDGAGWPADDVELLLLAAALAAEILGDESRAATDRLPAITADRLAALRERAAETGADAEVSPVQLAERVASARGSRRGAHGRRSAKLDVIDLARAASALGLERTAKRLVTRMDAILASVVPPRARDTGAPGRAATAPGRPAGADHAPVATLCSAALVVVVTGAPDPALVDRVAECIEAAGTRVWQCVDAAAVTDDLVATARTRGIVVVCNAVPTDLATVDPDATLVFGADVLLSPDSAARFRRRLHVAWDPRTGLRLEPPACGMVA
jgi:hypothetical protein